jgi:Tol biopolymer transport system component
MRVLRRRVLAVALWLGGICFASASAIQAEVSITQDAAPEARPAQTKDLAFIKPIEDGPVRLQTFRMQGELADYSHDGKWVVYDCKHQDGYYNIHVCRPDGTEDRPLSTLNNGLPHRHAGSPKWHPSMKYIVFAAEKKIHDGGSIEAIPGFGGRSNLWVMLADGTKAWQLTDTPNVKWSRVIIPTFSPDGTKLVWSEQIKENKSKWKNDGWAIRVADFVDAANRPELKNIRSFEPGGSAFYETYGFSPDGKKIIFCSNCRTPGFFLQQIFDIDADGSNMRMLTDGHHYHEHASYTPDGHHIVWMNSMSNKNHGTDWWMMNQDGSNKMRLTHFNQKGFPESCSRPVYACTAAWAPNGNEFLGCVQYSLIRQEGRIIHVGLSDSILPKTVSR